MSNVILRKSRVIPFGYKISAHDSEYLEEIPLEIEAIETAKKYIKDGYSYRATLEWLISATGRQVSIAGLWKLVNNVRKSTSTSTKEKETEGKASPSTGDSPKEGEISQKTG